MTETARRVAAVTGIAAAVTMCGLSVARNASGTTGSPAPPDTATTTTTATTTAVPTHPTTEALHGGGGGHTSQEPIASLFPGAPTGTKTETPTTTPRAKPDKVDTPTVSGAATHTSAQHG